MGRYKLNGRSVPNLRFGNVNKPRTSALRGVQKAKNPLRTGVKHLSPERGVIADRYVGTMKFVGVVELS